LPPARHGEVHGGETRSAALETALTVFDRLLELAFQGIRGSPDFPSILGIERGETLENLGEGTSVAAQELGFELLEASFVRLRDLLETLPQRF
jgi:hypothetical protein